MSDFELQSPDGVHRNNKFKVARAMLRLSMSMAKPSYASLEQDLVKQDSIIDVQGDDISSSVVSRLGNALKPLGAIGNEKEFCKGRDLNETDEAMLKERETAFSTLSSTSPFSYLPKAERQALVSDLQLCCYQEGDVIIEQGRKDDDVYVTREGRVLIFKLLKGGTTGEGGASGAPPPFKYLGYLDAPEVFGEFGPLFETSRASRVVAGGTVTAYRMSGERFLRLLPHAAFKLKMARGLREKGLFNDNSSFVAVVQRSVALETHMDFDAMLKAYRGMVPAIHAQLHSSALDIEGWTYAIRRLPENVTSTSVFLLSNSVPMPFMHPSFDLEEISVPTVARRRLAFAIAPSKLLVVMREKFSDVLDFASLLCAHIHESHKLRGKLSKPAAFDVIHGCLWSAERRLDTSTARPDFRRYRHALYSPVPIKEQADALAKLPLDDEEIRGLQSLWPNDFLYRVWDIIAMHENIQVRGDFSAAHVESSDRWAESIRIAAIGLVKQRSGNDAISVCDMTTHIISSNTTSVRNLLSPYIRKHSVEIHKWGKDNRPDIEAEPDLSDSDKLCALCTAYMQAHAQARDDQDQFDASCIKIMYETELTGIQVELYDLDALCEVYAEHNIEADSYLAPYIKYSTNHETNRPHRLLVNIDYAFGRQAEQLISALCLLFGESIASVGVMGKAGGLQGKRGDVVVADYLVDQLGDDITPIDNYGVDRDALARLSRRKVWSGGVLTVLGTLLQDKKLLQYYKKLMGCKSIEMEGSFYAKEVMRFRKLKLLSDNVHMRFMYYFSDTPLSTDQTETLSKDMGLSEVIPPQYAVTRELLRLVLSHDMD